MVDKMRDGMDVQRAQPDVVPPEDLAAPLLRKGFGNIALDDFHGQARPRNASEIAADKLLEAEMGRNIEAMEGARVVHRPEEGFANRLRAVFGRLEERASAIWREIGTRCAKEMRIGFAGLMRAVESAKESVKVAIHARTAERAAGILREAGDGGIQAWQQAKVDALDGPQAELRGHHNERISTLAGSAGRDLADVLILRNNLRVMIEQEGHGDHGADFQRRKEALIVQIDDKLNEAAAKLAEAGRLIEGERR